MERLLTSVLQFILRSSASASPESDSVAKAAPLGPAPLAPEHQLSARRHTRHLHLSFAAPGRHDRIFIDAISEQPGDGLQPRDAVRTDTGDSGRVKMPHWLQSSPTQNVIAS